MEDATLHEPEVAAEVRAQEFLTPPTPSVEGGDRSSLLQKLEARLKEHPLPFLAGGFIAGAVLGVILRR